MSKKLLVLCILVLTTGCGDIFFSNSRYAQSTRLDAAYFFLDDVGPVFSGEKDWDEARVKVQDLGGPLHSTSHVGPYMGEDFAILIRVSNLGKLQPWGSILVKDLEDQRRGYVLEIPSIPPSSTSTHVLMFRSRTLSERYVTFGPYVQWMNIYTK